MSIARSVPSSKSKAPRFDVAAVQTHVGEKVFARGEAYYRRGAVDIFALERDRALAQVQGSESYRVELIWRGKRVDGACSCPAFDNDGFCKHMVAVALAALAADGVAADGLAADVVSATDRICEHLRGMGLEALVEMIVGIAEHDPALYRRLDSAVSIAMLAGSDDKTIEAQLRKLVDSATRTGGFVEYAAAQGWAAVVDQALGAVADLSTERAALALKLAERAIDRIEKAIEHIDDSDGHCSDLLDRAANIHLAAAFAARPEPVAFARNLFAREMASEYNAFVGAAQDYADMLGEAGLAEYRRLAMEGWEKLPAKRGKAGDSLDLSKAYRRLRGILDFFAERDGDVEARIALRAKGLSSPWDYVQLAAFCVEQGRAEEALRRAEEGLRAFDGDYLDGRLISLVTDLLVKLGRKSDADAHLRRAFMTAPSLSLYELWRKVSGTSARDDAIAFLESGPANGSRKVNAMFRSDSADLLIRILMRERRFAAAWEVVGRGGVTRHLLYELAKLTEKTHPNQALDAYAMRVDELVGSGANRAYEEAVQLIARMATLRNATEQESYVATIKARFERKRNFMKLLG